MQQTVSEELSAWESFPCIWRSDISHSAWGSSMSHLSINWILTNYDRFWQCGLFLYVIVLHGAFDALVCVCMWCTCIKRMIYKIITLASFLVLLKHGILLSSECHRVLKNSWGPLRLPILYCSFSYTLLHEDNTLKMSERVQNANCHCQLSSPTTNANVL